MNRKEWLLNHGQLRTCSCGNIVALVPQEYEVDFHTYKLLLVAFPMWTCTGCKKTRMDSKDYIEWIGEALQHYEETGDPTYTRTT